MNIKYVLTIITIFTLTNNALSATDMGAHNKRHNYRDEIKMPTQASEIQILLGVKKDNWSTFDSGYGDCQKLDKWSKEDQEYFSSQNARKSKKYLTKNSGESYTLKESKIETTFYSCLSKIQFIKLQVSERKKYRKLLKEDDIPRLLKKHQGFNAPKSTLNSMVYKNVNENIYPSKKDIFLIDMYKNTYVILQMTAQTTALFYDTDGKWPSIFFIAPSDRLLKEGVALNNAADYYTFEGVKSYKNRQGFDRQAYIIRGHTDADLRKHSLSFF